MKKIFAIIAVIVFAFLATGVFLGGDFACAESSYSVSTVTQNGSIVGVKMSGYFFANSGILSSAEVYSVENRNIDFNFDSALLSDEQRQTKSTVLDLFDRIAALLTEVSAAVDTDSATSDVGKYNAANSGETVYVGEHTLKMLQIAAEVYALTEGRYNPAAYRLVDLWGFSSRVYSEGRFGLAYDRAVSSDEFAQSGYPLPQDKFVKAFSAEAFLRFDVNTDYAQSNAVVADGKTLYPIVKTAPNAVVDGVEYPQWLDLGGIAKGYCADLIAEMLSEVTDEFLVDTGTSSQVLGKNVGGVSFKTELVDPYDYNAAYPQALLSLNLSDVAISTSGLYVRNYVTNGTRYTHIMNCKTGKPVTSGAESATVLLPKGSFAAAKSDCLSTVICTMSAVEIASFASFIEGVGGKLVVAYLTDGGVKQVLTTVSEDDIISEGGSFQKDMLALSRTNGGFEYLPSAGVKQAWSGKTAGIAIAIVLSVLAVVACVAFAFWRKKNVQKVDFKTQRTFMIGDVIVYLCVALVVVVLLSTLDFGKNGITAVKIVDMQSGEAIAVCNVVSGEVTLCETKNRTVSVHKDGNTLKITVQTENNGKTGTNVLTVQVGSNAWAQMTDSDCGFGKDCVRTFNKITAANQVIVCAPNGIKVVAE